MTRQNLLPDPAVRNFEVYTDFSGGLNTEISNERLKDNEFPLFKNVDLISRGSGRRRSGRTSVLTQAGNAQGGFFYYRTGIPGPDLILAVSGRLYVKPNGSNAATEIPITDSSVAWTFQTTLPIEAIQYKQNLFVATGTKLVEVTYNGSAWTAVTATPYTPSVMEAIYIGTNGLAADPDAYVQDGTSGSLTVVGIKPAKRTGTVNAVTTMTAYISKPAGMTSVDYQWESKKSVDATWVVGKVWTAGAAGKSYDFTPTSSGNWDVRVTVRDTAVPATTVQYVLSSFVVNQVEDKLNSALPTAGIQTSRRIMLHWDRLILYGDNVNAYQMYVSDLNNPRYFPVTNTINFDTGKREPITTAVRFQNMLVVFTATTIQTLVGKSPDLSANGYQRYQIHDGIGCTAPWSAIVVGNNIVFRSYEGIQMLKPNPYRLETMNVSRVDMNVRSGIPFDADSCAMFYDNQYWLCVPSQSKVYRFYYESGAWAVDESTKLKFRQFVRYGDDVYNLTFSGSLYKHDKLVYNDAGEVYDMDIESKYLDFSASFNNKKLRKIYVLARHFSKTVDISVRVKADSAFVLTPEKGQVTITPDGYTEWLSVSAPNMHFYAGTVLGNWVLGKNPLGDVQLSVQNASVRGKCRRVKVRFTHSQDGPCEIYGFAFEFKLKKP